MGGACAGFWRRCRLLGGVLCCLLALPAWAGYAGPAAVATARLDLWPAPIDSRQGFDKASRAYLLIYAAALEQMAGLSEGEMLQQFRIRSVNRDSVASWLAAERQRVMANYRLAGQDCNEQDWTCPGAVENFDGLVALSATWQTSLAPSLQPWRDNLSGFSQVYLAEQMRLAALFPKVTSEIALFGEQEWNGEALADRQFFLSFDDGPTISGGNTDKTLAMLREQQASAVFFVLGKNLDQRLAQSASADLTQLYQGQCVGSHGWEHKSHAKWDEWQDSIERVNQLLQQTVPTLRQPLFRPPYGQRPADSGAFFTAKDIQVALWNLDSQDWNRKVESGDIVNRMITLMLIKRHGVLLFHDIHPKAVVALPFLFERLGSGVQWGDCRQLAQR